MSLLHAQTHNDLTVRVTNLNNNNGVVQLGLYNVASKFPKVGKTYKMVRLKTKGSQGVYTFKDLPQGRYALAIYHDENANRNCDTNFLVYQQRHMRFRIMLGLDLLHLASSRVLFG